MQHTRLLQGLTSQPNQADRPGLPYSAGISAKSVYRKQQLTHTR